jgi:short-subunit dehydrogenase
MSTKNVTGAALVTGASRGIGAVYAERLAQRGYDLVLVARDQRRLDHLASRLAGATKRKVTVIAADLTQDAGIRRVEEELAYNNRIHVVVNNAGVANIGGTLAESDVAKDAALIQLNIVAFTRIARASAAAFVRRRYGTLVNLSSALALHLRANTAIYSGTKAYVLQFSRVLQQEVGPKGVTVQVVLPGAVATDIWQANGIDLMTLPKGTVMSAEELVDAALTGLDQGELVTLPSVPSLSDWDKFEAARLALTQNLSHDHAADRYKQAAQAA